MSNRGGSNNRIQSTQVTFRIIEFLREHDGATVSELAEALDRSKGSVHNYLSTLRHEGYVRKDNGEYSVSLRFLELGGYAQTREELYQMSREEMKRLVEETGEVVNLMIEDDGMGVYLDSRRGSDAVDMDMYPGYRVPLHQTALGKAILAGMTRERVEEILDAHGMSQATEATITSRSALFDELEEIRERGVAFDDEERIRGVRCVATSIQKKGSVVGAVGISAPVSRMDEVRFREELPQQLTDSLNIIELNISFSGPV